MSQQKQIKTLILGLLKDGEIHSSKEICNLVKAEGIIGGQNTIAIRNAIYRLKRENSNFITVERGKYMLNSTNYINEETKMDSSDLLPFDQALNTLYKTVEFLKHFNWVTCSDEELTEARRQIAQLKTLLKLLDGLFVE